jgi:hypothetical protein
MYLINSFLLKKRTAYVKGKFFSKIVCENCAFYCLDTEPKPEPYKIVTVQQHCLQPKRTSRNFQIFPFSCVHGAKINFQDLTPYRI